jgi:CubicO group peptidase (beta-lactamase class C family)
VFLALTCGSTTLLAGQSRDARTDRIARSVDALTRRAIDAGIVPAIGVALAMDGRTVYARSHGMADATARIPATDATLWYVASTSKSLTGFGISLLADRGAFSFDDPISALLPGMRWHASVHPEQLTLARFLSHTHGVDDRALQMSASYTGAIPESQWPTLVPLAKARGSMDLEYSNFGYNIAAMVIDAVRPEGWRAFLQQNIYDPVGMRHTYVRVSGLGTQQIARPLLLTANGTYVTDTFFKTDATMNSAGGHLSTVHDLARWIIVQMDSGKIDGVQVFPTRAVVRSQTLIAEHTREAAKRFGSFDRTGWGAGWDIGSYRGERMVSRFGSYHTMRSHVSFLPGRRIGVVAVASGGLGQAFGDLLATYAYDQAIGRDDADARADAGFNALRARIDSSRQRRAAEAQVRDSRRARWPIQALAKYEGVYSAVGLGQLELAIADGALRYRWGVLYGPVEPYDLARNQVRIDFAGSESIITFSMDGRGAVSSAQIEGVTLTRAP